ncbi:hypothetical protein PAPYR_12434 [Paratrimastix pyriformis]|uniref:Peptide deformylase n=1 Tax=Paratrimastix pyriformis TaxID=342808 RepID=A0ABQ8U1X4_9EUKA|nr:hypothetical protein PAPYR_12434 [Paratrimastix pyriformis]
MFDDDRNERVVYHPSLKVPSRPFTPDTLNRNAEPTLRPGSDGLLDDDTMPFFNAGLPCCAPNPQPLPWVHRNHFTLVQISPIPFSSVIAILATPSWLIPNHPPLFSQKPYLSLLRSHCIIHKLHHSRRISRRWQNPPAPPVSLHLRLFLPCASPPHSPLMSYSLPGALLIPPTRTTEPGAVGQTLAGATPGATPTTPRRPSPNSTESSSPRRTPPQLNLALSAASNSGGGTSPASGGVSPRGGGSPRAFDAVRPRSPPSAFREGRPLGRETPLGEVLEALEQMREVLIRTPGCIPAATVITEVRVDGKPHPSSAPVFLAIHLTHRPVEKQRLQPGK